MTCPVILSQEFLAEAGGWKELKKAHSLHSMGRVEAASYHDGFLEGIVREGSKSLKVRMRIESRTELENDCPCFKARKDGNICAHALAIGLEVLQAGRNLPGKMLPDIEVLEKVAHPTISDEWPFATEVPAEDAAFAQLFLVVSPNFMSAWDKGQITVGVEIVVNGKRKLLKALDAKVKLFFEAHDLALYGALQSISPKVVPGVMFFGREDFTRILSAIPGHPGIFFGKNTPAKVSCRDLRPRLQLAGKNRLSIEWPSNSQAMVTDSAVWVLVDDREFRPVASGMPAEYHSIFAKAYAFQLDQLEEDLGVFQKYFKLDQLKVRRQTPSVSMQLEGSLNHLDARLHFYYPESDRGDVGGEIRLPDLVTEQCAVDILGKWGFVGTHHGVRNFILNDRDGILRFLAYGYPELLKIGWNLTTGERFAHSLKKVEPVSGEMRFRGNSGEDWFEVGIEFSTGSGDLVSNREIRRLLQMGQNSKKLANGKFAVLDSDAVDEFSEVLTDCEPDQVQPGTYRIDSVHADYLRETATDMGFSSTGNLPWMEKGNLRKFHDLPENLSSKLRPYQKFGIEWMQHLAGQGKGGILADDMGLGKTVQTLAFIRSVGGPALVICPSSLIYNWLDETKKFTPDLNAVAIEGAGRANTLELNSDADIFVTSYALFRRDEPLYQGREMNVIILDEAQHIKNPETKLSQAIHRLSGKHRFALTGTPMENSIQDVWSILRFACPGYLGPRKMFSERFEKPIVRSIDCVGIQRRLSRRLRPVILRRLKRDVATDLPEKIEQVIYCDLTSEQRDVYQEILQQSRKTLIDADGGRKRMLALTALLRLRQTCCDLRLLGLSKTDPEKASVKSDVLAEIVDEAIEGGHRVLVFSQFVEVLQIMAPVLGEKGISFCYLDGKTRNRGQVVTKFQEDDQIPLFLISLKAGGVGLNLTGADTVIHLDPWWNPAVEAQATDRAHRIGQTRVVNTYKLIARNTVEEKILSLQNRKRSLTEKLLDGVGGVDLGDSGLTEAELYSLLE